MYDSITGFQDLPLPWLEALPDVCALRQAPRVNNLAKQAQELKKSIEALEAKYLLMHKELSAACVHPITSVQVLEHSRTDTLGNNRITLFTVRCGTCSKYLAETSENEIRRARKVVLQPIERRSGT